MLSAEEFWKLSIEDRQKLSTEQLEMVLRTGTQEVIDSAPPTKRLKLQSLQSRCDQIRETVKNKQVVAAKIFSLMLEEGLHEMKDALQGEHPNQQTNSDNEVCDNVIPMVKNAKTSE